LDIGAHPTSTKPKIEKGADSWVAPTMDPLRSGGEYAACSRVQPRLLLAYEVGIHTYSCAENPSSQPLLNSN
jgi:hypothetical protein